MAAVAHRLPRRSHATGPEEIAARTRPMNTLLGIVLGVTLWFATRRLFSEGAANVALALFAFIRRLSRTIPSPRPTASAPSSSFSSHFNSSDGDTIPTGRKPCYWDWHSADCCWPSSMRLRWYCWRLALMLTLKPTAYRAVPRNGTGSRCRSTGSRARHAVGWILLSHLAP